MKIRSEAIKNGTCTKGSARNFGTLEAARESHRPDRAWTLTIFVLAFALYFNVLQHAYVMDDYGVLRDDFLVKRGIHGISTILQRPYRYGTGNVSDNLYRPFSQIMFAVEWEISPGNPALSHFLNVLFYATSGSLLFMILRRILPGRNAFPALLAALLWLFHPVHSEVVANIKSRDEIMAAFFLFLSVLSLMEFLKSSKRRYMAGSLMCFLLALFSKESAIAFLFIFPIISWYFLRVSVKRNLFASASFLIPTALYLLARQSVLAKYAVPLTITAADNFLVAAPDAASRVATAIMILGKYLLLLFYPYRLVCDYSYNQIPIVGFDSPLVWISLVAYAAALVYALINFTKKSVVVFAIIVYLVTISICSNMIILIGTSFAERLLFLPSVGICLLAGVAISRLAEGPFTREKESAIKNKSALLIAIIILSLFAVRTVTRSAEWKNEWTLISADIQRSPNSARMRYAHGIALRDRGKEQRSEDAYRDYMKQAIREFERCVSILPTYMEAYQELGLAWQRLGNADKALQCYERALKLDPKKAATYSNMAIIFFDRKDYDKALELHQKAVALDPNFENGYLNIGSIYGQQGNYGQAIENFEKVIRINPANAQAYYYLGLTYDLLDQPEKSRQNYAIAAQLDPAFRK